MSTNALSQKLQKLLDDAVSAGTAPGLVAVIFDRTATLGGAAAGIRDSATKDPVTLGTVCWMASMGKSVSSIAALKLVEQMATPFDLDSNDALAAILPELKLESGHPTDTIFDGKDAEGNWKFRPARIGITLRHLLLHTAGFEFFFNSEELHSLVSFPQFEVRISADILSLRSTLLAAPSPVSWRATRRHSTFRAALTLAPSGRMGAVSNESNFFNRTLEAKPELLQERTGSAASSSESRSSPSAYRTLIFDPLGIPASAIDTFRTDEMNKDGASIHALLGNGSFIAIPFDSPQFEGVPPEGMATLASAPVWG